jgi:hypothetical protein
LTVSIPVAPDVCETVSGTVCEIVAPDVGGKVFGSSVVSSSLEGPPPSEYTVTIKFCPIYRSRLLRKGDKTKNNNEFLSVSVKTSIERKEANKQK